MASAQAPSAPLLRGPSPDAFLAAAVAASADALIGIAPDETILTWNPAAERLFGYEAREVVGRPFMMLVPADREAELARILARVGAGETVRLETVRLAKDGRRIEVRLTSAPIIDAYGRVAGRVATLVDIGERLRLEQERRLVEERLSLALECSEDGIWDWNVETGESYLSPRWYGMLGYLCGELPAHVDAWDTLLHPDDRTRTWAALSAHLAGETPQYDVEQRLRHRDGHYIWVQSRGKVVERAPDGRALRMVGTLIDISARKVAKLALKESEERFRTIAEAAPVGIAIGSPELEPIYANPRMREILGTDPMGLPPERWITMIHPDDRERVMASGARFISHEVDEHVIEYRIVRHDGRVVWLRDLVRWRYDVDGTCCGYVTVMTDITAERTVDERLQHAQRLEAVGQLAGGIAHEFNNLLTVVTGNLGLARDALPTSHPVQHDLREVARAGDRARDLVRQLLAFGRRQMLRPQPVDVGALVLQAERLLDRVVGHQIVLAVQVQPSPMPHAVLADPAQLDQVLVNLAINARDAMLTPGHGAPGNGGTMTIAVDAVALDRDTAGAWAPLGPGAYVRLVVRDTGHGMDAETRARAFEPFFTTKPIGAGTGLGLSTVEGIVAQSGGAIRVDSAPGEGTTFTLLFPALAAATPAPSRTAPAWVPPLPPPDAVPGSRGTVLVVDDDENVRGIACRTVERAGFRALEARNGAEALLRWRAANEASDGSIVALVADVRMPLLSGPMLAWQLRRAAPTLPVVLVSGDETEPEGFEIDERTAFLAKPFSPSTLTATLEGVVRAVRAG